MAPAKTQFWIFMEDAVFLSPLISVDILVARLLQELKGCETFPSRLAGIRFADCNLYKFSTPLANPKGTKMAEWTRACAEASDTWIPVDHNRYIEDLASPEYLCDKYACLVIEAPKAKDRRAINTLTKNYKRLFESLQIYLNDTRSWTKADITENGGVFESNDALMNLERTLAQKRTFVPRSDDQQYCQDRDVARKYGSPNFEKYFEERQRGTRGSELITNSLEFVAYYSVLRCHLPVAKRISDDTSSHFKASQLCSYFFVPPFSACREENSKTIFRVEMPWGFPLFIAPTADPTNWCKYTPCSDFSVRVREFLCPLLICEVISDPKESDRYRMLVQGIAAVRAANVLKKPGVEKDIFVVAVYLKSDLTAERYLMHTSSQEKVSILRADYNLLNSEDALNFLKDMFNLQDMMNAFVEDLDTTRMGFLADMADIAGDVTTLTQQRKETKEAKTTMGSQALDPIPEYTNQRGRRAAVQTSWTKDPEIKDYLAHKGYGIDGQLFFNPNVAPISQKSDSKDRGYIKFTRDEREVDISEYLATLDSPQNHTIADLRVWRPRRGEYLIYSSPGGSHLVRLKAPDVHMWSAAKQLVEGIAFMHEHNIAHLDIKPANILMHPDGGRLSIIDFSTSERVTPGEKLCGTVGTEGYIAPEVLEENSYYDPIRADLWSCGRTLEELTSRCKRSSREKDFLVGIARMLMADDPLQRPMMSEVLAQMVDFESVSSSIAERPPMNSARLIVAS